ncbi:MAG: thrombospondin type 3 repeat-containing protein [Chloroflexi bacterium]|nr:thrombospondin type 3 repeat-containing protein [Chloroflexota bacterium]
MKRNVMMGAILLALVCILLTVASVGFVLLPREVARPLVSIESPRQGERIAMGEGIPIHSIARDSRKVKRVELWVDGVLQSAESAMLPEGVSPFPLTTLWYPPKPGSHTLTVRAFNTQGGRSFASVNIEVVQSPDRDKDGVSDNDDACPDQLGSPAADGCPDRDNDQIRDADDACPDQPGTRQGRGCPSPSTGDRDGDGVADSADGCPEQPGAGSTAGCPDRDSDGVRDATDACPDQPGSLEGRGCPGTEVRDGAADSAAACPGAGCPDRDGDGVRDAQDLCPDTAGPRENSGCPVTAAGDRDNDGVRDDTDLAPEEAGPAESGGAPAPGGGFDRDGDSIADDEEAPEDQFLEIVEIIPLDTLSPGLTGSVVPLDFVWIEFDALEFELSSEYAPGTAVYCYAGLGEGAMEQIGPFDSLGHRQWDIAEWSGGANSRRVLYPRTSTLDLRVNCYVRIRDLMGQDHLRFLGAIGRQHPSFASNDREYDGRIQNASSVGGEGGQSFSVRYRLCSPACANFDSQFGVAEAPLTAPVLYLRAFAHIRIARWDWEGDRSRLTSFRIYVGEQRITARPFRSSTSLTSYWPACGTGVDVFVTAVGRSFDGSEVESPRSNTVTWEGAECQRQVRVTFERVRFGDIGTDEDGRRWRGPAWAHFTVPGSTLETLTLLGGHCGLFRTSSCWGVWVEGNTSYTVQSLYDAVQSRYGDCYTNLCRQHYVVPWTDSLLVELAPDDNLQIRVRFCDNDAPWGRTDCEYFFDGRLTLRPNEITNGTKTIQSGNSEFFVRVELLNEH